ncbi:hypothetical protein EDB19DRAFT_2023133 [Suillus lakei]|nr:hypothetical protein EDB19DRAFT_2023133 [Suillus lakei]
MSQSALENWKVGEREAGVELGPADKRMGLEIVGGIVEATVGYEVQIPTLRKDDIPTKELQKGKNPVRELELHIPRSELKYDRTSSHGDTISCSSYARHDPHRIHPNRKTHNSSSRSPINSMRSNNAHTPWHLAEVAMVTLFVLSHPNAGGREVAGVAVGLISGFLVFGLRKEGVGWNEKDEGWKVKR